jgi:hypothetical protein|tara:strand:- start:62 stop:325 length:264 start_codon:yes stop_codon:yes gene_type:complete
MYILTLADKIEGVFSVIGDDGDQIIPIFEQADDAQRYNSMMVLDDTNPRLQVVEIDEDLIVGACEERYQKYAIITKDDFLIPPKDLE